MKAAVPAVGNGAPGRPLAGDEPKDTAAVDGGQAHPRYHTATVPVPPLIRRATGGTDGGSEAIARLVRGERVTDATWSTAGLLDGGCSSRREEAEQRPREWTIGLDR